LVELAGATGVATMRKQRVGSAYAGPSGTLVGIISP
jgi:hypothetical protein